jgi:hypothetical protein
MPTCFGNKFKFYSFILIATGIIATHPNTHFLVNIVATVAVKGLSYETATQNGTTDEKGTFKYKAGEAVTFKIGEMVIGRTTGADVLYPTHITDSKPAAVKVAQVLQTLDKEVPFSSVVPFWVAVS